MTAREQWKPIPGWEDRYDISNRGRVRNAQTRTVRALSTTAKKYRAITFKCGGGATKSYLIHRLVALAFIGSQPTAKHNVGHRDGDRSNNRAENLRWVTQRENEQDKVEHGTFHKRGAAFTGGRLAAAFAKSLDGEK